MQSNSAPDNPGPLGLSAQSLRGRSQRPLILIWHRHRLFRECLAQAFQDSTEYRAMTCLDWQDDSQRLANRAEISLVDILLPDVATIVTHLLSNKSSRVLLLLPLSFDSSALELIGLGVHGCILEEASFDELCEAVKRTMAGDYYVSSALMANLFPRLAQLSNETTRSTTPPVPSDLTKREREILRHVASGLSNRQIAEQLSISVYTVKNHVHNLLEKMRVDSRHDAVRQAQHRGWITSAQ